MKIRLIYILVLWTAVVVVGQNGISIDAVFIDGPEKFSQSEVKSWLGIKTKSTFSLQQVHNSCIRLLENYADNGYPFTRIDSVIYKISNDSSSVELFYYLTESDQVVVGDISLAGLDSLDEKRVKSRFDTRSGKKFNPPIFDADMADAVSQIEKKGHPFVNFELKKIKLDSANRFYLDYQGRLGPRLVIDEIQVTGNTITRKNVIEREIRIKTGSVFDPAKVEKIRHRLMRLGFFESVAEPKVFWASKNTGGLLLNVKEGNPNRFDGVLGYNPGTDDESGYFTGLVDISLGNLFGTGRSLLAHMQKRDRKSQDLKFHYREPWLAGLPVDVGLGFEQLIQDSTYIQRDMGVDLTMPILDNFSILARVFQSTISPDSLSSYQLGLPKSRSLNAALSIQYDSRDDLLNPQRGIFYQTGIESGTKKNTGPQAVIEQYNLEKEANRKSISLDVAFFSPVFKRQIFAFTIHGRQIKSDEKFIPISDQFRLGGARTLRGYREFQFRGSTIGWSNLEYRYILGRRSRAFVFFDSGYYIQPDRESTTEAFKIGYGLGFRLETGLGIMGIDYGLGEGDGMFNGKLHVGLVNEF